MWHRLWNNTRTIARRLGRVAATFFVVAGLPWPAAAEDDTGPVTERVERLRQQLRSAAEDGAGPAPDTRPADTGKAWTDWNDWDDWAKWANLP